MSVDTSWKLKTGAYRRVIQLELNELSYRAISKLVDAGQLPTWRKILHDWGYSVTQSETEYQYLEPWIQWATAHTGLNYAQHKLFHLGDVHKLQAPQIWETLSAAGIEAVILASMNAKRGATKGGIFFPDPWSFSQDAYPQAIKPLWNLVHQRVNKHSNSNPSATDIIAGVRAIADFKVPLQRYQQIAWQLCRQILDKKSKWRLAGLFDLFLSDLFSNLLANNNARYFTLFLNSVAHYQHHYWRQFEPELFNAAITAPDCHKQDNPMLFGYQNYDTILARILGQIDLQQDLVIIATGLAQQPYLDSEREGGMNYYRLRDHHAFAEMLGIQANKVHPLMSRDWQIGPFAEPELQQIAAKIAAIKVADKPLFNCRFDTADYLFIETQITRAVAPTAPICLADGTIIGEFRDYLDNTAVKSGHHIGEGSLWVSDPRLALPQSLPLTDLYDLNLLGLGLTNREAIASNVAS